MTLNDKKKFSFADFVRGVFSNRFLIFTALFLIAGYFVFLPYKEAGKSLVCNGDASIQHYPALAFYGSYIREIIKTLLFEHRLVIPDWDITLGYGGDVVSTLHYYCVGDPIALLSVLFRADQSELCYNLLIVLRLYLSGMAMLCYCKYRNSPTYSSVIGALVYCFSGYAISPGVFHPFFTTPMIWFPLILLGSELLLEKKNPFVFTASVAISLLSNFYFFYMQVIFVVMYVLLRYFTINKKLDFKDFGTMILKFFSFALVGIMIAMPVFLPNIVSLLQSDRISVDRVIPAFYPEKYYLQLPEGLVSEFGSYYVYLSISAVAILSLFILLSKFRKENLPLIISAFVLLSFLLLPKIGSAFNGFNYVTNRWVWALAFAFGYIAARALPMAEDLKPLHFLGIFACTGLFYLACYMPDKEISEQTKYFFIVLAFCVFLIILVSAKLLPKILFRNFIAIATVFTVCVNGYYHASPQAANWAGNSHDKGQAFSRYYESLARKVNGFPNEGEGRYDGAKSMFDYNTAMLYDMGGTGFYFSTINPGTAKFQNEQMLNYSVDQQYRNLDGRTYLAAALSVEYFMAHENTSHPKLYGYTEKVSEKVYTSEHTLPLVYVFDSVYTDNKNMTVTQRQQALLQRAVTSEDYGLPDVAPEYTDYEVPFTVKNAKDVTVSENGFSVAKPNATMTISFDSVEACELYCIFEGIDFDPQGDVNETNVKIDCGKIKQTLQYKTADNNYTSGKHNFLVNLGYNENGRTEFKVTFPHAGEFTFSDFRVVAQPMDTFFGYVDKLADSGLTDVEVDKDVISFSLKRQKPGIAVISIPYQDGWKATLNGEKVEIIEVQGGLCGIYVEDGNSDVVMEYNNPVKIPSYIMFFGGTALLTTFTVVYMKRKKENVPENIESEE